MKQFFSFFLNLGAVPWIYQQEIVLWEVCFTNAFFRVLMYFYDESEFIETLQSPLTGQSFLL